MTIMESNYRFIGKTCEIAKTLGASAIRINFYKDFNNLANKSLKSLTGKNLKKVIFQIGTLVKTAEKNLDFKVNFENSLATTGKNKSTCGAGTNKLQIDTNGNVTPCIALAHLYSAPIKKGLVEEWQNNPIFNQWLKTFTLIKGKCNICGYRYICGGGCRANVFGVTNNIFSSDPWCWFQPKNK